MTDTLARHNTFWPFLIILGLVVILSSCGDLSESQTRRVEEALSDTLLSTTETWDVDMKIIKEGLKKVRLTGSYAATYQQGDSSKTRIQGPVFIQVFDSTGAVETWASSNRAVYRASKSEFELFGNVRVRTDEDRRLSSEYLKWDQIENRVYTPRFVIITTPSDSIAGNGFEGTTDLSEYTIREVTGQFTID